MCNEFRSTKRAVKIIHCQKVHTINSQKYQRRQGKIELPAT